jgi:aerobic carbon-monoxide dehydrogenase small subunit
MNKIVKLTVNGERRQVSVTDRTQLAEVLRDHLDLTGTHVGCEQGVCGACTVIVDGKPIRSCIAFAQTIDGAEIETIEGYAGDSVMIKLREAFSRHHALQCGYCTPGMLATSHDILSRYRMPSEAKIRNELSGNLCRCTGYQGIVQAITDVAEQLASNGLAPNDTASESSSSIINFAGFDAEFSELDVGTPSNTTGSVQTEGNWTVVERSLTLAHGFDSVWTLFSDVKKVAECVPGAKLTDMRGKNFDGEVTIAFGPIKASFKGNGTFETNETNHTGLLLGQGADKGGQSNVKGELSYALSPGETNNATEIGVEFRFQIQGMLAQFNRPELVTGFIDFLLDKFIANCDAILSGGEASASHKIGLFALGWAIIRSLLKGRQN